MKLADAKPGDILQDVGGAVWLRGTEAAVCLHDPADRRGGDHSSLAADPMAIEEAEKFGPFVRLVPDAEAARLQAELDALRAIIESGAESTKSASDLLAKVNAGDYQWPSGVAWAVREAHRRLTGGPPDVVYVRDDLRGLAGKGAE